MVVFPETARPYHIDEFIAYVNDNGYGAAIDTTVLDALKAKLLADIEDPAAYDAPLLPRIHPDGPCNSQGYYPLSFETGNPADTAKTTCKWCRGFGKTKTQNPAIVTFNPPEAADI